MFYFFGGPAVPHIDGTPIAPLTYTNEQDAQPRTAASATPSASSPAAAASTSAPAAAAGEAGQWGSKKRKGADKLQPGGQEGAGEGGTCGGCVCDSRVCA